MITGGAAGGVATRAGISGGVTRRSMPALGESMRRRGVSEAGVVASSLWYSPEISPIATVSTLTRRSSSVARDAAAAGWSAPIEASRISTARRRRSISSSRLPRAPQISASVSSAVAIDGSFGTWIFSRIASARRANCSPASYSPSA